MNRDLLVLILSLLLIAFVGVRGFMKQKRRIENERRNDSHEGGGCTGCCSCCKGSCSSNENDEKEN